MTTRRVTETREEEKAVDLLIDTDKEARALARKYKRLSEKAREARSAAEAVREALSRRVQTMMAENNIGREVDDERAEADRRARVEAEKRALLLAALRRTQPRPAKARRGSSFCFFDLRPLQTFETCFRF